MTLGSNIGQNCVTVLYPNGEDVHFDFDYYRDNHLPLIMRLYGSSIQRFELRRGLPGPDNARPTYVATVTIWIADTNAFAEAGAQHTQELVDDVKNFTNVMPMIQTDEVCAVAGA